MAPGAYNATTKNVVRHDEESYAIRIVPRGGEPYWVLCHREQVRDLFEYERILRQKELPDYTPLGYYELAEAFGRDAAEIGHTRSAFATVVYDNDTGKPKRVTWPRGTRSPTPQEVLGLSADLRSRCEIEGHDQYSTRDLETMRKLVLNNAMHTVRREEVRLRAYEDRERKRGDGGARAFNPRRFTESGKRRNPRHSSRHSRSPPRRRRPRRDPSPSPPLPSSDDELARNDLPIDPDLQAIVDQEIEVDQQVEVTQQAEVPQQVENIQQIEYVQPVVVGQQAEVPQPVEDVQQVVAGQQEVDSRRIEVGVQQIDINRVNVAEDDAMVLDDESLSATGMVGGEDELGVERVAGDGNAKEQ